MAMDRSWDARNRVSSSRRNRSWSGLFFHLELHSKGSLSCLRCITKLLACLEYSQNCSFFASPHISSHNMS